MTLETTIAVARGEEPADLLLKNARLVNVLSGEIHPADIAIFDPAKVEPLMTRLGQNTLAAGFSHTIVNGQVAFEEGQATDARAGQVIRA